MNFLTSLLDNFSKKKKRKDSVKNFVKTLTGKNPKNIYLYDLAFKHASLTKHTPEVAIAQSNERLEYLGDAILSAVIAEYLFKKFPYKDEGFLTEIRSRLVNGESLNILAKKIGIDKLIEYNNRNKNSYSHKSMYGDALEAFIGSVYLDFGFIFCKKFILHKLLENNIDIAGVIEKDENYKSKLLNWGQSQNKKIKFEIIEEKDYKNHKEFTAQVSTGDEVLSAGKGGSKKKAEQDAARRAIQMLKI
ncbi:MAG: ribonuclease III [Cytophagales bacterium]|nr:ribonuclease III [Cytophagales bacterium]